MSKIKAMSLVLVALAHGPHEVLDQHHPHDVVDALAVDRDPAVPGGDGDVHHVGHAGPGLHRDHVGARDHHVAHHGVTEVDDGVDQGPLLVLDDVLGQGGVGHGQDHLLRHVWALRYPAAGQDEVGDADQAPGGYPQRSEGHQQADERCGGQGGPLAVLDGPGLGGQLGEDEDDHHLEHGGDEHPDATEDVLGHHTDQGGGHQRAQLKGEEDDGQHPLGVLDQAQQGGAVPAVLLDQGHGLDLRHAGQRGLRQGQEPGDDDQHDRHHEQHDVRSGQRVGRRGGQHRRARP
jgi:hypothetical protein